MGRFCEITIYTLSISQGYFLFSPSNIFHLSEVAEQQINSWIIQDKFDNPIFISFIFEILVKLIIKYECKNMNERVLHLKQIFNQWVYCNASR